MGFEQTSKLSHGHADLSVSPELPHKPHLLILGDFLSDSQQVALNFETQFLEL